MFIVSTSRRPRTSQSKEHLSERARRRIIELLRQGKTQTAVADALGIHRNTVRYTIQHLDRTGHVRSEHGGGKPMTYNEEQLERLRSTILQQPQLPARGLIHAMGKSAPTVSDRTIQRYRRRLDVTPKRTKWSRRVERDLNRAA